MKQIFEIEWSLGKLTPELLHGLLHQYFETMKHPIGYLSIKELNMNETTKEL